MFKPVFVAVVVLSVFIPLAQADTAKPAHTIESLRQQGYSVHFVTPIFSQLLTASFPRGFKPVFENTRGPQYIQESVLTGENENQWTQMITITGVEGLASNSDMSPKIFAERMAGGFKLACPSSFSASMLAEGKISGYEAFTAVLSCGTSPSTGGRTSESALVTVIKGERDYYTVQWAERAKPSRAPIAIDTAKWVARFKRLAPIQLCTIVPDEAAPYPSCVGLK